MPEPPWRLVLSAEAETDFVRIIEYTRDAFGPRRAALYETSLLEALLELEAGPEAKRSRSRDDLRPGIRSLSMARRRRRGRHVIFYRVVDAGVIQIVRILHDAMDFESRLT